MEVLKRLFSFIIFSIISVKCLIVEKENNVCPTFKDYYTIKNNSNCWYALEAEYLVPDIIKLYGYPLIEYEVVTEDGYILTLFRIPSDNVKNPNAKGHPIYLQHGLVATCANFLGLGKNSLAFLLADAGYDIWLGNYRGTQYSSRHVNISVYDQSYWEHSMDEIVMYDFPAIFRTILQHSPSNSQIIYIGHSLGTTLALMFAAEYPELSNNIFKMFVFMSPAYSLAGMMSPYKVAAPYGTNIVDTVRRLEMFRVVSHWEPLRILVRQLCLESPPLMRFCFQLYNLFYGPYTQMGPEIIPVYFNQLPGGTSLKILNHAADLVLGNFRKYNYFEKNYEHYGQFTPPIYDIKKIMVPIYLLYSRSDWATTERDTLNLYKNLRKEARFGLRKINILNFNHMDFVFGRHVRELVYDDLIRVLDKVVEK